ncbi:MAG: Peptide deformylase, partial [uncultured Craurococcus sp.]
GHIEDRPHGPPGAAARGGAGGRPDPSRNPPADRRHGGDDAGCLGHRPCRAAGACAAAALRLARADGRRGAGQPGTRAVGRGGGDGLGGLPLDPRAAGCGGAAAADPLSRPRCGGQSGGRRGGGDDRTGDAARDGPSGWGALPDADDRPFALRLHRGACPCRGEPGAM